MLHPKRVVCMKHGGAVASPDDLYGFL